VYSLKVSFPLEIFLISKICVDATGVLEIGKITPKTYGNGWSECGICSLVGVVDG
jgi:hypothetical protein